jgi:hypothetical protein
MLFFKNYATYWKHFLFLLFYRPSQFCILLYSTPKTDFPIPTEFLKIKYINFLFLCSDLLSLLSFHWPLKLKNTSHIQLFVYITMCWFCCVIYSLPLYIVSHGVLHVCVCIAGVTVPTLHVGMLFTTCCWYRDPHGLPWVEYLHTGANKIW